MCGIAGIAGLNAITHIAKEPDAARIVRRMNEALAHRGPDNDGLFQGSDAVLGHRRLGIIDLSAASDQPMTTPDGRWTIVFNGEIYNYRKLRAELDVPWRSGGDAEVLLHAWAKWGEACLPRLEGMFAFAIWDASEQELCLVRDRLGVKPLYLARHAVHHEGRDAHGIAFASEVRALLRSGVVEPRLNRDALPDYVRYGTVHGIDTLVRNVTLLRPGSLLRFRPSDPASGHPVLWWHPVRNARVEAADLPVDRVRSEVRERLGRAVEKRLVADVPFGAFLSGGIDSSAVVGLMAQCSTAPVHTFSVVFDEERFSEERYARLVAKRFGTRHTAIRLRPDDMLRLLPNALEAMDHPSMDGPNTYVVSKVTKEAGITMALSGLGGDEVFAGYDVFKRSIALQRHAWVTALPRPLRALAGDALVKLRKGLAMEKAAELLKLRSWDLARTYPIGRLIHTDRELERLLGTNEHHPNAVGMMAYVLLDLEGGRDLPLLSQVSLLELSTYLHSVLLRDADQMSMAHALEVRVPFLDHDLVEFVLGVPDGTKYPSTPKRLLVESLGDLLPREIVDRPKMGFTLPWADWMRNQLRSYCESKLHDPAMDTVWNATAVRALWKRFLAGDMAVTWGRVWHLVVLSDWMQRNGIDR